MGRFSLANGAGVSASSGPPYFSAGFKGKVRIVDAYVKKSSKGPHDNVIVTAEILEVEEGEDQAPVGCTRSYVYVLNNQWVFPDLNAFAVALVGVDASTFPGGGEGATVAACEAAEVPDMDALLEFLFREGDKTCEGVELYLHRWDKETSTGAQVRKAEWSPVVDED